MATSGEYIDLHELAKGWKAAIARTTDPATKHESQIRNDRGNLPLHSATSFRAPIEVAGQLCVMHLYMQSTCTMHVYLMRNSGAVHAV